MIRKRRNLMLWYVYIMQCSDNTLYTGTTTDIVRRLKEHNDKKGSKYVKIRIPVKLVYKETCPNRPQALKREAQIKRWTRKKKIALIKGDKEQLKKLSKSRD